MDKELITPVEDAAEPMSTRKRPRSQDSETSNRAKMRAVSADTGKRESALNPRFDDEGWKDTDFGDFDPEMFENEPLPAAETEVFRKPEEAAVETRSARLKSSTTTSPVAGRDKDWGKEDIANAAPLAGSNGPSARGSLSRMRSPAAVQSEEVAASEPSRRVPLQPLSANVDKSLRPQSASSQLSTAGASASRAGPMRKYGKQLTSIAEEDEQSRASEQSKAKAEDQRKQEQFRQLREKKRHEDEQAEKQQRERERQERQRREEKERKEREEAERKERLRAEERERHQRKEEENRERERQRFLSISQELVEMGVGSEPGGATSSRTRSSKRARDESFADVEEEEADDLPWDRDAGTSAADESTALSK